MFQMCDPKPLSGLDPPGDFKRSEGGGYNQSHLQKTIFLGSMIFSLNINDNGSGFDTQELEQLLESSSAVQSGHVGLLNVYHRLSAYYGKDHVQFSFSSIPYYCNVISIRLPLTA